MNATQVLAAPAFTEAVANALAAPAPLDFYSHRSGHETWQYCPRRRYLAYHHLGTGVNIFPPIYFEIGTCVHAGLAFILEQSRFVQNPLEPGIALQADAISIAMFQASLIYPTMREFDRQEQETLISGLIWAFWFRVWPSFTNRFEVLMVEPPSVDTRDFEVLTASDGAVMRQNAADGSVSPISDAGQVFVHEPARLHLLSRPDAIIRDRQTGEIVAINWKTINSITDERRLNITNSLQVNLESHYAETLYSKWMDEEFVPDIPRNVKGAALMRYLEEATAYYKSLPREVAYTQIIYLVKGNRVATLADGTELGTTDDSFSTYSDEEKFYRQDSALCYQWVDLESSGKLPPVSWGYRFYKKGNKSYNQLTKAYARQPIWETDKSPLDWVQSLNAGSVFPSTISKDDDRNAANPLDKLIFFDSPIYRDTGLQTELRTSTLNDEMNIAQALIRVDEAVADGELLDSVLTREFPMRLVNCRKPTRCEFDGRICNQPQDARQPLFTILPDKGPWMQRVPHHAAELRAFQENT